MSACQEGFGSLRQCAVSADNGYADCGLSAFRGGALPFPVHDSHRPSWAAPPNLADHDESERKFADAVVFSFLLCDMPDKDGIADCGNRFVVHQPAIGAGAGLGAIGGFLIESR